MSISQLSDYDNLLCSRTSSLRCLVTTELEIGGGLIQVLLMNLHRNSK